MRGWFITGTDTGVGKTIVAAALARWCRDRGYRVGVCKPVATGVPPGQPGEDTRLLMQAAGLCDSHFASTSERGSSVVSSVDWARRVTPWSFPEPAAPTVAARLVGQCLDFDAIVSAVRSWQDWADWLVVEGIGGLLCPLTEGKTVADLAAVVNLPLVIVSRTALGTLNHTLLTVEAAQRRGLPVAGIVLNESTVPTGSWAERTCEDELRRWLTVPILARIPHAADPIASAWQALCKIPWDEFAGPIS
jgi:dethiobiotin synthetase